MLGTAAMAVLVAAATPTGAAPVSGGTTDLRLDTDLEIGGVGIACTGIGESKYDPRWRAYPLRLEFSDMQRQYLTGAEVALSTIRGMELLRVTCQGAWVLLRPPDRNSYRVEARIIGTDAPAQSRIVRSPARGQARVVVAFRGV